MIGLAFLVACAAPPRITGKTHEVKIVVNPDTGCPISVDPPDNSCQGISAADVPDDQIDQTVCVRIGEAVRWTTSPGEERRFKVHLDPFGEVWRSTPWYAPKRRDFTRGPRPRRELAGASVTFKYAVTVDGCDDVQLDPYVVVRY